jgi:hypothetical protein
MTRIDESGAYKVTLTFDMAVRSGFTRLGAQQLVNALPLSGGTDRNRLVTVLGRAAAEKTGSIVYLSHSNEKWLLMEWLNRAGVSRLGAQQTVNVMPVLDYRDRTRIAALVAMCQVNCLEDIDSWSTQI